MKSFFLYPFGIYVVASITALGLMIIIDYLMGSEAEHLNAWVILNNLLGIETDTGDSLAIKKFGLWGATALMLLANALFGLILINLLKLILKIIQFF